LPSEKNRAALVWTKLFESSLYLEAPASKINKEIRGWSFQKMSWKLELPDTSRSSSVGRASRFKAGRSGELDRKEFFEKKNNKPK